MSIPFTENKAMLNAVTATTTSEWFDVSKRQLITIEFIASAITSGNGVFSVDASNDMVNAVTGIAVKNATTTTSTTLVTSVTLSSNTAALVYVPPGMRFIRTVCTRSTDGTYSAIMQNGG